MFCHEKKWTLECRRFPPTRNEAVVGDCKSEFPYTEHDWWCGEYKKQQGETNETVYHSLLDEY